MRAPGRPSAEALRQLRKLADDRAAYVKHGLALDARTDSWVKVAREHGVTWAQVADALGVSKQGAQQRYGR